MNTFEVTVQRKVADGWPVVAEQSTDDGSLPIRAEGVLTLDPAALLPLELEPRPYGMALGRAVFADTIRDAFATARTASADDLRVLLDIEAPDLRTLRWERLCAPFGRRWSFLALDQRAPFSLYLPSVTDRRFPPFGRSDLRALVVVASPTGLDKYGLEPFDTAAAIKSVTTALGDIPADVLAAGDAWAGPPTLDAIAERITAMRYTLLHVVCHGQLQPDGESVLYLDGSDGTTAHVSATQFIERLGNIGGARGLPHLAFLATCESAAASAEAEGAFGGLAQRLVRELGMPAVVAMTEKITVATAQALAAAFYRRLREHGEVDRALVEATAGLADRSDVTVPALYSRLGGRPLFSDTLGRSLTATEIGSGLDRLEALLPARAPVLEAQLNGPTTILRSSPAAEPGALSAAATDALVTAQAQVDRLCLEATDLGFKALALGQDPPAYDDRQPFRGLYPFRAEDRPFFFGREPLVEHLQVRLGADPFLAILGPSGSGKSSLVLAGLLPTLEGTSVTLTPGADPPAQLEAALASGDATAVVVVDQFEELFTLCQDETKRTAFISRLLGLVPARRVVLTMRADFWGECAPYPALRDAMQAHQELIAPMDAAELRRAMEQQASVVGLRFEADLANTVLDEVQGEPGAMPLLQHALLELWKRRHGRWLRADEYRAIGGVRQAIAHTADELYATLDDADKERVHDIFVRLTRLDDQSLGAGSGRETRRRVLADELVPAGADPALTTAIVARLADARLVVTSVDPATGRNEVEVAHEALIRYWPLLQGWLDAGRADLRLREGIREAALEWDAGGRSDDLLVHRAGRLEDAVRLSERPLALNDLELAYVQAAVALRDRERQHELDQVQALAKRARRLKYLSVGLAVVLVLAAMSAVYANDQRLRARHQSLVASSQQVALQASILAAKQPDLSLLLGIEATRIAAEDQLSGVESLSARGALLNEVTANPRLTAFMDAPGKTKGVAFSPDGTILASVSNDTSATLWDVASHQPIGTMRGHTDKGQALAFDRTGTLLATGSEDKTVVLWDVPTQKLMAALRGHTDVVSTVAFSPHEDVLASGGKDQTVIVWDAKTFAQKAVLTGEHGWVQAVAFSPDGKLLASAGADGTVLLRETTGYTTVGELTGQNGGIHALAFGPDSDIIATGSVDGTIVLWDVASGKQVGPTLKNHSNTVTSLAFNPLGQILASTSLDGHVILWSVATRQPLEVLSGTWDRVYTVAFSHDGKMFATGDDRTVMLWTVAPEQPLATRLSGNQGTVEAVAFSPDGSTVAVGDGRRILLFGRQLHDLIETYGLIGEPLVEHTGTVRSIAFSPDGKLLASGGNDRSVILWDVQTHVRKLPPLTGHTGTVQSVAFSPDGKLLASGGNDHDIILWDVATGARHGEPLVGHQGSVVSVAFSPDGKHLASGGLPSDSAISADEEGVAASDTVGDPTLLLWDLTRQPPSATPLTGQDKMIRSVAFSSDGSYLASGGADTTVVLRDGTTGAPRRGPVANLGHPRQVYAIAFSPDGRMLATGSNDGAIRLWDVASGQQLGDPMTNNGGVITSLAFSPDGELLASGSDLGFATLWDVGEAAWMKHACARANRNLYPSERQRYFPGTANGAICPAFPVPSIDPKVP